MSTGEEKKRSEGICICRQCPTFVDCKEEIAFCLSGSDKSKCIKEQKGCICGGCPLAQQMGFERMYYCVHGSDRARSKINKS